ncbi:major capsid protein [Kingella negevensis]|uniref:major capsid protein n=2 Tax=Kingella negevensis TaxID=1522312 RepID=UPI00050A22DC|nr:major capsid protein [Kingella negevensis]MDK4689733.1 major capsid protein [Kingella negevensis]
MTMNVKQKLIAVAGNQKVKLAAVGTAALAVSSGASAAIPPEVTKAITDGFADAQLVAYAILTGLAVIYGISLAKRLLK